MNLKLELTFSLSLLSLSPATMGTIPTRPTRVTSKLIDLRSWMITVLAFVSLIHSFVCLSIPARTAA